MENYNGNGQYGYSSNFWNNSFYPKDPIVNRDAGHLTKLSLLAGAAVIGFSALQDIFLFVLRGNSSFLELYKSDFSFQCIFGIMLSIICVFLPFFVISRFYSEQERDAAFDYGRPVSTRAMLLAAGAGLMLCWISDYISGGFEGFISTFGINLRDVSNPVPDNAGQFLLYVIESAVVPAIAEEFAIRGVIMQPLRKYGNGFAIVMSSIVFAIMHGTVQQIPFALSAGLALGFFAISTGTVWTSVIIHFLNNLLAVVIVTLNGKTDMASYIYFVLMLIIAVVGIYCLIEYRKEKHNLSGVTVSSKKAKIALAIAAANFGVISYMYSLGAYTAPLYYIIAAVILGYFIKKYVKSNKTLRGNIKYSSLKPKLMISLYCGTPTLIAGVYSLLTNTASMITLSSALSYYAALGFFAAAVAGVIVCIRNVVTCNELESVKLYKVSEGVLIFLGVVTLLSAGISLIGG